MPETVSRGSGTGTFVTAAAPAAFTATPARGTAASGSAARPHRFRGRIGVGLAGGFYPAPHRYQLYLSEGCRRSLRISITLALLGLRDSTGTTVLTRPAETPDAFAALRRAYEATSHHYEGPFTAPALCDRWSGRVVSNHTPDILRGLADLSAASGTSPSGTGVSGLRDGGAGLPALRPAALAGEIDALRDLLARDVMSSVRPEVRAAALALLDRRLSSRPYVLGEELSAADVDLWVALTHLGTAAPLTPYPRLAEYVRRLGGHPAFIGGPRAVR